MKKSLKTFIIVLIVIAGFVLLPPLIKWMNGDKFVFLMAEVRYAIFLGLISPFLIWLSAKMKSSWLFVLLALVIISLGGFLLNILFPA